MTLTATLSDNIVEFVATLDPKIIADAKKDLFTLAKEHGFTGTFENFLDSLTTSPSDLISSDDGNALKLGSDGNLVVSKDADELITTFDYTATINAVWSI